MIFLSPQGPSVRSHEPVYSRRRTNVIGFILVRISAPIIILSYLYWWSELLELYTKIVHLVVLVCILSQLADDHLLTETEKALS